MDDEERRRWRGDGVAQEEETKVNDLVTAAFTTRNKRADGPKCPVFTSLIGRDSVSLPSFDISPAKYLCIKLT